MSGFIKKRAGKLEILNGLEEGEEGEGVDNDNKPKAKSTEKKAKSTKAKEAKSLGKKAKSTKAKEAVLVDGTGGLNLSGLSLGRVIANGREIHENEVEL